MVVAIIDQDYVFVFKRKRKPPVSIHCDCPMTFKIMVQRMQSPSGRIHVGRGLRPVQRKELQPEATGVLWLNACLASGKKEPLNSLVPERPDHADSVAPHATLHNGKKRARHGPDHQLWRFGLQFIALQIVRSV